VGEVGNVAGGENQRLGEAAVTLFVLQGVLRYFLDDLAVGIGRRDLALDLRRIELPFILQPVAVLVPVAGSITPTSSRLLAGRPGRRTFAYFLDASFLTNQLRMRGKRSFQSLGKWC